MDSKRITEEMAAKLQAQDNPRQQLYLTAGYAMVAKVKYLYAQFRAGYIDQIELQESVSELVIKAWKLNVEENIRQEVVTMITVASIAQESRDLLTPSLDQLRELAETYSGLQKALSEYALFRQNYAMIVAAGNPQPLSSLQVKIQTNFRLPEQKNASSDFSDQLSEAQRVSPLSIFSISSSPSTASLSSEFMLLSPLPTQLSSDDQFSALSSPLSPDEAEGEEPALKRRKIGAFQG